MSSKESAGHKRHIKARTPYDQLSEGERKIIDYARRRLAEDFAAANGWPIDQALEGVVTLHERGHLILVANDHGIELVPCLDGEPIDGRFDFATVHHTRGGRS